MSITLKKVADVYSMYSMYHHLAGAMYLCGRLIDGLPGYRLIIADVYKVHAYFDYINYVWTVQANSVTLVQGLLAGQQFTVTDRML